MKDMILQFVERMTHEEKVELQMALERAIAEEMVPEAGGEADACPRCGCPEFVRKGHGRKGEQRWLQHYLDWFCYREQFRKSDADRREVAFADAAAGKYQTSRREYALAPHPFVEYWDNNAMSTVV